MKKRSSWCDSVGWNKTWQLTVKNENKHLPDASGDRRQPPRHEFVDISLSFQLIVLLGTNDLMMIDILVKGTTHYDYKWKGWIHRSSLNDRPAMLLLHSFCLHDNFKREREKSVSTWIGISRFWGRFGCLVLEPGFSYLVLDVVHLKLNNKTRRNSSFSTSLSVSDLFSSPTKGSLFSSSSSLHLAFCWITSLSFSTWLSWCFRLSRKWVSQWSMIMNLLQTSWQSFGEARGIRRSIQVYRLQVSITSSCCFMLLLILIHLHPVSSLSPSTVCSSCWHFYFDCEAWPSMMGKFRAVQNFAHHFINLFKLTNNYCFIVIHSFSRNHVQWK